MVDTRSVWHCRLVCLSHIVKPESNSNCQSIATQSLSYPNILVAHLWTFPFWIYWSLELIPNSEFKRLSISPTSLVASKYSGHWYVIRQRQLYAGLGPGHVSSTDRHGLSHWPQGLDNCKLYNVKLVCKYAEWFGFDIILQYYNKP